MSVAWMTLVALLTLPLGAQASGLVDLGVVAVEVDAPSSQYCPVEALPPDLCLADWNTAGTTEPGDDVISLGRRIDEARVVVRPPLDLPAATWALDLRDLRLEHPAFRMLNGTWVRLNDSRPEAVRDTVAFESRPFRYYYDDGWHDSGRWGLFLVVYPPVPLQVAEDDLAFVSLVAFCYDSVECSVWQEGYVESDEHGLRPFQNSVILGDFESTDSYLLWQMEAATYCHRFTPDAVCSLQSSARDPLDGARAIYERLTPSVTTGFQINRTLVRLDPPGSAVSLEAAESVGGDAGEGQIEGRVTEAEPVDVQASSFAEPPRRSWLATASTAIPDTASSSVLPAGLLQAQTPLIWGLAAGAVGVLVAWLMYHRITRERALEQATRRELYGRIVEDPGVRAGTLAARCGLAYNSVKHHLDVMTRTGLVRGVGRGHQRYVAVGRLGQHEMNAYVEALSNPATRAVYDFLRDRGETEMREVWAALSLARSTVSEAAARLRQSGLVEVDRRGGRVTLRARPLAVMPQA